MRIVAHEHKVLAAVLLQNGQHLRQLTRLHHHKDQVVEIVRSQCVHRLHPVDGRFALYPVADDQPLLVDHLLPLAPRKKRNNVLFVLRQHMCQLAAQNARAVNQDPHPNAPPLLSETVVLIFSGTRRSLFSRREHSSRP